MNKTVILGASLMLALGACGAAGPQTVTSASQSGISIQYKAYGLTPTITPQAQARATNHCQRFGKRANYAGMSVPNLTSSMEIHRWTCDGFKANDQSVIDRQASFTGLVEIAEQSGSARPAGRSQIQPSSASPTASSTGPLGGRYCRSYGTREICTDY